MRTVHVHTGDPYDILIERGILDRCGAYVRELSQAEKVVVVTDDNVAPHYFWRVLNSLEQNGLSVIRQARRASTSAPSANSIMCSPTSA